MWIRVCTSGDPRGRLPGRWHSEGQGFESPRVHLYPKSIPIGNRTRTPRCLRADGGGAGAGPAAPPPSASPPHPPPASPGGPDRGLSVGGDVFELLDEPGEVGHVPHPGGRRAAAL